MTAAAVDVLRGAFVDAIIDSGQQDAATVVDDMVRQILDPSRDGRPVVERAVEAVQAAVGPLIEAELAVRGVITPLEAHVIADQAVEALRFVPTPEEHS